jgi:hypothetical protein
MTGGGGGRRGMPAMGGGPSGLGIDGRDLGAGAGTFAPVFAANAAISSAVTALIRWMVGRPKTSVDASIRRTSGAFSGVGRPSSSTS